MSITSVFLLPRDVELIEVGKLSDEKRRLLDADDADFAVTRLRSRSQSKVIDASTARLLQCFKEGKTIVNAVIEFCKDSGHEPEPTLEAAYPVLKELIKANFLAPEGSEEAAPVEAGLKEGDEWAGLKVIRAIQVLEDSEIYQASVSDGELVALKLARSGTTAKSLERMVSREAKILKHLDGSFSPTLVKHGEHEGRPYLAAQWREGVHGARAAARLRSMRGKEGRRKLLDLCCAIVDAYSRLHEQNVIHGDVHPGNLIIGDDGKITIVDFGYARL